MNQLNYQIRFAELTSDLREEEAFIVTQDQQETEYRLQDYGKVFAVPLLYENLCSLLKYQSPETVAMQLITEVIKQKQDIESLVVFEIAAGTGLCGKHLHSLGVKSIVGVDIVPEAAMAANRDYPDVYEKYYVEDLTDITPIAKQELVEKKFNTLVCCSSLSCHFPIQGFINSFNLIENDGWITFNVNTYVIDSFEDEDSFEQKKAIDFSLLYQYMIKEGILEVTNKHYYIHRFLTNGKPLDYVSVTARKREDIPENWQV